MARPRARKLATMPLTILVALVIVAGVEGESTQPNWEEVPARATGPLDKEVADRPAGDAGTSPQGGRQSVAEPVHDVSANSTIVAQQIAVDHAPSALSRVGRRAEGSEELGLEGHQPSRAKRRAEGPVEANNTSVQGPVDAKPSSSKNESTPVVEEAPSSSKNELRLLTTILHQAGHANDATVGLYFNHKHEKTTAKDAVSGELYVLSVRRVFPGFWWRRLIVLAEVLAKVTGIVHHGRE